MGEVLRQVEGSATFLQLLEERRGACFLCAWTLFDLTKNGKLTGWPLDAFSKPDFPISAKLTHAILELGDSAPDDWEDDEDLASVVAHLLETSTTLY
jgi:hypothetical protein